MSSTVRRAFDLLLVSKYRQDSAARGCFSSVSSLLSEHLCDCWFRRVSGLGPFISTILDGGGRMPWGNMSGSGGGQGLLTVPCGAETPGEEHTPAEQSLPSSLRRRSAETSGHRPRWFYRPCAEERGHFQFTGCRHAAWRHPPPPAHASETSLFLTPLPDRCPC